jgi:tetratricopeptide (TPR) repeat protein
MTQFAQMVLATMDVFDGHPEAAAARLAPYRSALLETGGKGGLALLAEAYLLMGEEHRAVQIVDQDLVRDLISVPTINTVLADLLALRITGMVRSQQGRWEEARQSFEDAIALGKTMSASWFVGWALYDYGLMDIQLGDLQQARDRLQEALAIFQRLGAHAYVRRTEQTVATLTLGPSHRQLDKGNNARHAAP